MKNPILFGAAVLIASLGYATENTIRIGDRAVVVTTEQTIDGPQTLQQTVLDRINREGWKDVIYNSASEDRAFLFFTQRIMRGGTVSQVKVTFWKAQKVAGRTTTESWVYVLRPDEVNQFLDEEFTNTALRFKATKQ